MAVGLLGHARSANAQSAPRPPLCIPGTPLCATTDAQGRVRLGGSGSGNVGPGGANVTGQAGAQGSANATGNAQGNVNATGNAQGGGSGSGNTQGNANVTGNAQGGGGEYGDVTSSDSGGSGGSSSHYRGYTGRFGVGTALCPIVRVGIWSGFKAGGCVAVSFRFEALTFEMETQLLYGGTTHAFDWTFPMSFLIPLANEDSLFEGGYLRFGGSPIGATFAHRQDGGSFVRFGLFAGAGYEVLLSDYISWRVIDARLSFDMGTRRAMDTHDHWVDLGLQLGTGLVL